MGFRREAKHYKLIFEDPDLAGLEVIARSLPLRDFLTINKLSVQADDDTSKQVEQSEVMLKKFAEALIGWNLEDDHSKPVPATYQGLLGQEFGFVMEIIRAWMEAIANVPKPPSSGSNGSGIFPEQSIPMAVS